MSPFMSANKIKKPILLIHGEEDNNPGTLTMQVKEEPFSLFSLLFVLPGSTFFLCFHILYEHPLIDLNLPTH
jgi:hypothetical protein